MQVIKNTAVKKGDRLSALIQRFHIQARVHSFGPTSSPATYLNSDNAGGQGLESTTGAGVDSLGGNKGSIFSHKGEPDLDRPNFFVVRRGQLRDSGIDLPVMDADVPLLVYYPRTAPDTLSCISLREKADQALAKGYVCAVVDTGGEANPIALALPDVVIVRLDQSEPLRAVTDILLEETLSPRCGGRAVIDRLCEIVVIRLLRHLIEAGQAEVGLLAGLADPNISLSIVAMHDNPERNFNLEDLAAIAAMSRTHFVNSFRKLVGVTPGQYLSNWRLTLARMELAKGTPLKAIAGRIGFSSSAALSRAYSRHYGVSPKQEMIRD